LNWGQFIYPSGLQVKGVHGQHHGRRFLAEIISYADWACHRFCVSFQDVEVAA
jgi:hypothetical protein